MTGNNAVPVRLAAQPRNIIDRERAVMSQHAKRGSYRKPCIAYSRWLHSQQEVRFFGQSSRPL
jgi:hypothetical protein